MLTVWLAAIVGVLVAGGAFALSRRRDQEQVAPPPAGVQAKNKAAHSELRTVAEADELYKGALADLGSGRYSGAVAKLESCMPLFVQLDGEYGRLAAECLVHMGAACYGSGEYERSVEYSRQALSILEDLHGPMDPRLSSLLLNKGAAYDKLNKPEMALRCYERALAIRRKAMGEDAPEVGSVLNNMAVSLLRLNRVTEAEPAARRALEILEKLPSQHTPYAYDTLGQVMAARGRNDQAEDLFRKAVASLSGSVSENHTDVADFLERQAAATERLGRADEAQYLRERATAIRQA